MAVAAHHALPVTAMLDHREESRYSQHPSPHTGHAPVDKPMIAKRESSGNSIADKFIDHRGPRTSAAGQPGPPVVHRDPYPNTQSIRALERECLASTNGYTASHRDPPSAMEVKLDALDRLQTQVNLNRAALETQSKEIHRIHDLVTLVQADLRTLWESVEGVVHEIRNRPQAGGQLSGERVDDTLELFAAQIADVSKKANEVDQIKMQLELMKRRLNRPPHADASPASITATTYSSQREAALNHSSVPATSHVPQLNLPRHSRASTQRDDHHSYSAEAAQAHVQSQAQAQAQAHAHAHPQTSAQAIAKDSTSSGWAIVNSNKRAQPHSAEAAGTPIGSPKRQKLATLEPRHSYDSAMLGVQNAGRPERGETEDVRSQRPSPMPYSDAASTATFIPYASKHGSRHDHQQGSEQYRVASLPIDSSATRGVGRPRGPKPRKSLPIEGSHHTLTPGSWEKEGWSASQMSPEAMYSLHRTPISRRESSSSAHPYSSTMTMQMHSAQGDSPLGIAGDPYAHTKKTRTKPIRNSDGVLIRKDGRPDMRSQSSAANLRKVHARKEEERRHDNPAEDGEHHPGRTYSGLSTVESSAAQSIASDSPMSAHAEPVFHGSGGASGAAPQQRPSTEHEPGRLHREPKETETHPEETRGTEKDRTERIMSRMFPHGVDEQRNRLFKPSHFFDKEAPKTAEPRTQAVVHEVQNEIRAIEAQEKKEDSRGHAAVDGRCGIEKNVVVDVQPDMRPVAQMVAEPRRQESQNEGNVAVAA